jgi:hypothetical protein
MAKRKKSQKSSSGNKCKKPNTGAATADQATSASSPANQQLNSKFMQLPQEIRDEIYANVFRSTRLAFGERYLGRSDGMRVLSSARGTMLALLRTCRRVKDEIGVSWLRQMLFQFEDPMSLMGKLTEMPIAVRKQIRHVRVLRHIMMVWGDGGDRYYNAAQYLKLLPGLELDTLTIMDDYPDITSYEDLGVVIHYGDGWKELHYMSRTSGLLGFDDYVRQPQPSDWQNTLEQHDGQASHPSVLIYRATNNAAPGDVLHSVTREVLTQDTETFSEGEDTSLTGPGGFEKELLVVVKRGAGVDYAVKEGSPYLPIGDIRVDHPGKTWEGIKARNDRYFQAERDDEDAFGDDGIVDTYSHVDEFTWPSLRVW